MKTLKAYAVILIIVLVSFSMVSICNGARRVSVVQESVNLHSRFLGKESKGNLVHMGNRHYVPKLARFITQDKAKAFQSSYLYTSGSPVFSSDPSGLMPTGAIDYVKYTVDMLGEDDAPQGEYGSLEIKHEDTVPVLVDGEAKKEGKSKGIIAVLQDMASQSYVEPSIYDADYKSDTSSIKSVFSDIDEIVITGETNRANETNDTPPIDTNNQASHTNQTSQDNNLDVYHKLRTNIEISMDKRDRNTKIIGITAIGVGVGLVGTIGISGYLLYNALHKKDKPHP